MAPRILPLLQVKQIVNNFIFPTVLTYHLSSLLFRNNKYLGLSDDQRYFTGTAGDCA